MRPLFLAAILALPAAAQDVPYYTRGAEADQDLGAINQNFREEADRGKDNVGGAAVPGDKCWGTTALCYKDATGMVELGPGGITFHDGSRQTSAAEGGGSDSWVVFKSTRPANTACEIIATANVWINRRIRWEEVDTDNLATLTDGPTSSTMTFSAGIWRCEFESTLDFNTNITASRVRLRDTTNNVTIAASNGITTSNTADTFRGFLLKGVGRFTSTGVETYAIEHRNNSLNGTCGTALNMGEPELYLTVSCTREQ